MLVVDDTALCIATEKSLIKEVCDKLKLKDYIIETAITGPEGLERFKKVKPQIVITDLNMPGEYNGDELGRKIRVIDNGENASVKLILVTSSYPALGRDFLDRNLKGQAGKRRKTEEIVKTSVEEVSKDDHNSYFTGIYSMFEGFLSYICSGFTSSEENRVRRELEDDSHTEPAFDAICDKAERDELKSLLETYIKALRTAGRKQKNRRFLKKF